MRDQDRIRKMEMFLREHTQLSTQIHTLWDVLRGKVEVSIEVIREKESELELIDNILRSLVETGTLTK